MDSLWPFPASRKKGQPVILFTDQGSGTQVVSIPVGCGELSITHPYAFYILESYVLMALQCIFAIGRFDMICNSV